MDYDDNDFQSQSFQLAGEENTKFPPGLRSFALPKFDLDDNLQVHLRFDTLVETEALLDIQSQEDNQWIEEFSRGSSGIEFSSGAAESCSISRHNNVWSEATSSESVEMLLKSVGQDELIPEQTIIKDSDACDGLGTLTEQMEPKLNQDGSIPSMLDVGPTLPPEKCLENSSGVGEDAEAELPRAVSTLQTDEGEKSGIGSSGDLGTSMAGEKHLLPVIEENLLIDGKCIGGGDGSLVDGSEEIKSRDNFTASEGMQVDLSATSVQNLVASVKEVNTQDLQQVIEGCNMVISYECTDVLREDNVEQGGEGQVPSKEPLMDDRNCEGNVSEISVNNVENPSFLALNVESTVQVTEGCTECVSSVQPVQVSEREALDSSNNTEGEKFVGDKHEASFVVVKEDNSLEGKAVEVSNINAGVQSSTVLKKDPLLQISEGQSDIPSFDKEEDLLKGDDHQLECGVSVGKSESALLTEEDNELFKGHCDRSSDNHVGNSSSLVVDLYSTTNIIHGTQATENIKDSCEGLGVHGEDYSAKDDISSTVQVKSMQLCESCSVIEPNNVCDSHPDVSVPERNNVMQICENSLVIEPNDASVLEKENVRISIDSGNSEREIDDSLIVEKRVASASQVSTGFVSEVSNLASCNKSEDVHHLILGNGIAPEDEKSASCVEDFAQLGKKDETVTNISTELSSLAMKECSRMASEPTPVSEPEQCKGHDTAGELLLETVDQLSSSTKIITRTCQNESQSVMADKPIQEYSKESEKHPVTHGLVLKENDGAEVIGVSHAKYEEESSKFAEMVPSHNETLTRSMPSSLEDSSCEIGQKDLEDNKTSLVCGDNNDGQIVLASIEGDAINGCESSFKPASEDDSEFNPLEAGSSSPNSDEPNCGSPTVISCSELPQNEKENWDGGKRSIDQNASVSDNVDEEARECGSSAHDPKGNNAVEDDRSFTFEVGSQTDLTDRETDRGWKPFSSIQPYEFPQIKEGSLLTSGFCQMDSKMLQEISHGSPPASDRENVHGNSKGTTELKTRRVSSKATDKGTAKEGKPLKELTPQKQTKDRRGSLSIVSPSSLGARSQVVQVEEMQPYGYVEGSARKPCGIPTVQLSSLPDLNTSASPSALFQQPFTDLQQVQLRAQIFVYGSLIQGVAPEEACMISAFGESDGGRSVWDNSWRLAIERLSNQKSPLSNPETPLHLHSGARVYEQATGQGSLHNKALGTPAGRGGSRSPPSPSLNSMIPLSSPPWSVATPSRDGLQSGSMPRGTLLDAHQTLSPLHLYQSPHIRHYIGNTSSWLSQAPSAGPWVFSPQTQTSILDASAHYPTLPITETGHVTSVRDSSILRSSAMQHSTPSPLVHSGGPTSVPAGTVPLLEVEITTASPGKQASADPRPRKRKKSLPSGEPGHICLVAQSQTEPVSAAVVTKPQPASVAITTPASSVTKIAAGNYVLTESPTSSSHHQIVGVQDTEQRVIFSDETCSKIEQAKLQAEDAAALAGTAVRHSQGIWTQLAIQKNSGLVSDVEAKLASAAVAVAAAASVAKAAAAAAKVASDAALQAKLMADEALVSSVNGNSSLGTGGVVTTAPILKGKDRTITGSIIVAAKEASRRRVEAAAAAAKRAENLDAVVKAAELAADAVSQAGAIIAMGDPIPLRLSEFLEVGPDGFYRVQQAPSEQLMKSSNMNKGEKFNLDGVEGLDRSANRFNERLTSRQETQCTTDQGKPPFPKKMASQSVDMVLVNGMHGDLVTSNEKGLGGQKGHRMSDLAKTVGPVPETKIGSRTDTFSVQTEEHEENQPVGTSDDNSIKEGSCVEVLSDKEALRRVWFLAKVLSLKDGKAYVCYTELLSDEGPGKLKEWVPLVAEGDKGPRIRLARSMTAKTFEGTRKRRRAAIGDYVWSVGDRVDAWTRDGWWEGIITEMSNEDETTLTVHFPAQGNTSIVRAWHLRPSLIWKDGQWMEWSRSRENNPCPHEGDIPQEKRPRLGRHNADIDLAVETRGKDKMSNNTVLGESVKPEESRSLTLSAKEKIFTVGKNIREGSNSDALGTKRTGLQKEGSRVIFGVPKPGKKRKFMAVSKHYVADRGGQMSEGNDSIKFTKYLIPQGSGSRGWKNTSRADSKGKRAAEPKPKVVKSGRTNRNISEKDSSLISVVSASNDVTVPDLLLNSKASVGHDENILEKQNLLGSLHNIHKATEGSTLFSSLALASDAPSSRKKSSSANEAALGGKGKLAPSSVKLARNEEKDAGHSDNVEPRRSNRRMQPTSRLLEGLQSSMIISKIPAVSHDKSTKAQHRTMPSSRGNNR